MDDDINDEIKYDEEAANYETFVDKPEEPEQNPHA